MPVFDQAHPKIIEKTFSFPGFSPTCRKSVHSINSFLKQPMLEFCDQTGHTHFLIMPIQNILDQLLIYVDLYQHAKNQAISLICSGYIVD